LTHAAGLAVHTAVMTARSPLLAVSLVIACGSPEPPPYGPSSASGHSSDTTLTSGAVGGSGGTSAGAPNDDEAGSGDSASSDSASSDSASNSTTSTDGPTPLGGTVSGSGGASTTGSGGTSGSGSGGADNASSDDASSDDASAAGGSDASASDDGGSSGGSSSGGGSNASDGDTDAGGSTGGGSSDSSGSGSGSSGGPIDNPLTNPEDGPPAGNPDGECAVPSEAGLESVADPDHVIGSGTPESCTAEAFIDAVAAGGVITFDCGPDPVTITLDEPALVYNDASDHVVIDGGGLVTLSGGGQSRILYMNTCDEDLVWTTEHCDDQEFPQLTVQNITFVDGNSKDVPSMDEERDGGGAIWARGGRFKAVNTRFFNNVCADTGPDVGGAVRVFSQYQGLPAYVVNTTFGGAEGFGNTCSNGGGISSIGVSWSIFNSVFSYNRAIGDGGNPAEEGTPGGGSGGAIYNDGQTMTLSVCGTLMEHNQVNAYGSAIFFVSNNHDGTLVIEDSVIRDNTGGGWNVLPSISMHEDTTQVIDDSIIE